MFDGIKAIKSIENLKCGKTEYLSDSQIVSCIVSLIDAHSKELCL